MRSIAAAIMLSVLVVWGDAVRATGDNLTQFMCGLMMASSFMLLARDLFGGTGD